MNPSSSRFTHLISDCDGVLIDSETITLEVLISELQVWMPDTKLLANWIRPRLGGVMTSTLNEFFEMRGIRQLESRVLSSIARAVETACDLAAMPMPGVAAALARIALPKAVVSNNHHGRVCGALVRTGLTALFDSHIYTPNPLISAKPSPDLYLAAARGLGTSPERCVVIEDSVVGVTAASRAGMYVMGFVGGSHSVPEHIDHLIQAGADTIFAEMAQLPTLIQVLQAQHRNAP